MRVEDRFREELRRDRPIPYAGANFHSLTVGDYEIFTNAKPAMELMLASLPPALARLSWFSALDRLDAEAKKSGSTPNFVNSILLLMASAMRLESFVENGVRCYPIRTIRDDRGDLKSVFVQSADGPLLFGVQDMNSVREIIAAQNGYEVPDENWNPDLVKAAAFTRSMKSAGLKFSLDDLVASVALHAGTRQKAVWDWSIREFISTQNAIDRSLNYKIFTQAEMSGFVKFKKGNPYPSWKFDRDSELPGDFTSLSELDAGANGLLGESTKSEKE